MSTSTSTSITSGVFGTKRRKIKRLDFVLAGAQKSGTTALHYFLSKHPKITTGDQQEIHFFDNDVLFVSEVDLRGITQTLSAACPLDHRR